MKFLLESTTECVNTEKITELFSHKLVNRLLNGPPIR